MMNNVPYTWTMAPGERRFNSSTDYFKRTFGGRMQKVSLHAGFTCPNRDGFVGQGGCTFCNNKAFRPSYCRPQKTIAEQIEAGIKFHTIRYKKTQQYLAYFQSYSNTYAALDDLRTLYDIALAHPQVAGLVIATRPDCVDDEKLDYIAEIAKEKYVSVEYGIESCYDKTLLRINRGHDFACTKKAIEATAQRGINTGAHMIFGLPGETKEDMLREAEILSQLPLHSIKFHQLQIVKNTAMMHEFSKRPHDFVRFTLPKYIDFFIDFLEIFNPNIIVERFAGEVPHLFLVRSNWGNVRNEQLLPMLDSRLEERDTWQGKKFAV